MKTNAKFAPGDVLTTRSICNHDCIYSATIISRTAKSVMVDLGPGHGGIVRRGLTVDPYTGNEYFHPYGRYSMAPSFRAKSRPYHCSCCGKDNEIVNQCGCDPNNMPTKVPTNIIPFKAA